VCIEFLQRKESYRVANTSRHQVPPIRVRAVNAAPIVADGEFVLYWMIAQRRLRYNFALDQAIDHARELKLPLVILEPLRCGYPWASDRLHRFVLDGMAANVRAAADRSLLYYPYVEPKAGAGSGLLAALAKRAAVVVTDDYPAFFLPRMVAAAGERLKARLEAVDSCGLLPMAAADRAFPTAYAFRRFLQQVLPEHLNQTPRADPLARLSLPAPPELPTEILRRWPLASPELLADDAALLAKLPIDHAVPVAPITGGADAARKRLDRFLGKLARYNEDRNEPSADGTSGLSPYLHFGHIGAHEVFARVTAREPWSAENLTAKANGKRTGWWKLSEPAEAFLDQLVTWRELGFNMCRQRVDYMQYESLPEWAQATLAKHALDPRPNLYTLEEFAAARTHDPLWNAAQRQLLREGAMHNYLRMLWGKKILEWSPSPQEALAVMIELNDKYAVDGRDPNSYSGIFWTLGRYDRPWGPERKIFGTIRYMSSDNTARKLDVKGYLAKYGPEGAQRELF
jgi:deoxyribodipyrimidine photo-lyase